MTLHNAVKDRNLDQVKALLEAGADINEVDSEGKTPLHYCDIESYFNSALCVDIALYLLKNGARKSISIIDNDGNSPLRQAALYGKTLLIEEMLNGKDRPTIDWEKEPFHSLLFDCINKDKPIKHLKLLFDAGANILINMTDNNGNSPLHFACENSRNEGLVRFLLANGASESILKENNDGLTPLEVSILNLTAVTVEEMLESVNIDWTTPPFNQFLIRCCKSKRWDIVLSLLEYGSDVNINTPDILGNTPLHYACSTTDNQNYIQILMSYGADSSIDLTNNENITPLQISIKKQGIEQVRSMLHKAKISGLNWLEGRYKDSLLFACKKNKVKLIEALLFSGADCLIDLSDENGNYPIHFASKSHRCNEIIPMLLKHDKGRNCLKINTDGLNAFSMAVKNMYCSANTLMEMYSSEQLPSITWNTKKNQKLFFDMVKVICSSERAMEFSAILLKDIPEFLLLKNDLATGNNIFHILTEVDIPFSKKTDIVKLFLNYGGGKALSSINHIGISPIHNAIKQENYELAKLMLKHPERPPFDWSLPEVKNLFDLISTTHQNNKKKDDFELILNAAKHRDEKLMASTYHTPKMLHQYNLQSSLPGIQDNDPEKQKDLTARKSIILSSP